MELFAKLGIDWRLLIAQLVNFAILFTALTFLLYKPLVSALDKRRAKIAESLDNAEKIGDELKRAGAESERIVAASRVEAARISAETAKQAEAVRIAATEKTRAEVASLIAAGKAQLAAERDAMTTEVRRAAAELIAVATEKVINEKMTAAKDKALIEKAIETN
jgi:F-type H+-transporting ATPase subunit b